MLVDILQSGLIFLDTSQPQSSRKRQKNTNTKRLLKKNAVERGKERVTKSGRIVPAIQFETQLVCFCGKNCPDKIDILRQKQLFDYYYGGNWSSKISMLRSSLRRKPITKSMSALNPIDSQTSRQFYQTFHLIDEHGDEQEVCRHFFYRLFHVNKYKCLRALKSVQNNPGGTDTRGKSSSRNKTSEADIDFLRNYIDKYPKYESHYGRSKSKKMFLSPSMDESDQAIQGI